MTADELLELCLSLPQAQESFPFGDETSVFKVTGNGKIFALSSLSVSPLTVSLKVDPEESIALREEFARITPGYHLNKKHWVTIVLEEGADAAGEPVPDELVEQLIRSSYQLVAPKRPRAPRAPNGS